ncbi:hypothetical protein [Metabacillus sp. 84]|uniref:hypothetical protein n=1 Tax=unclassified Metabacillus TaxID=2675274 RepID=UPI003CF4F991
MPGLPASEFHITIDEHNDIPQQLHPYQIQALKNDYRALIEENSHDPAMLEISRKAFERALKSIGYRLEVKLHPPA